MQFTKIYSQDLTDYQWKNRIILLKDTNLDSDWLQAQLKRLNSRQKEFLNREVLFLLLTDTSVYNEKREVMTLQADSIVSNYGLTNFVGLVLIGKDGGTKLKEEFIVNPSTIIKLIDNMPMRKTEISDSKKID
jgi:hypothetical protein